MPDYEIDPNEPEPIRSIKAYLNGLADFDPENMPTLRVSDVKWLLDAVDQRIYHASQLVVITAGFHRAAAETTNPTARAVLQGMADANSALLGALELPTVVTWPCPAAAADEQEADRG
jgi:hypothetical protein